MERRTLLKVVIGSLVAAVVAACGSVERPGANVGSPQPASPAPSDQWTGATVLTFVVRPGADPAAVGHRIAGPDAVVSLAYPDQRPRENLPMTVVQRSYVVNVPPAEAPAALRRAQSDRDVQLAYLGSHLGAG